LKKKYVISIATCIRIALNIDWLEWKLVAIELEWNDKIVY
jgi:hypothetical protein